MKKQGFTLIEILASLTLFSLAMVGLYFSMNSVKQSMATSLKRDVETSYANMLIAEVNPYDIMVETAYDITTKTNVCTHLGLSSSACPPEIAGAHITRLVYSCPDADMADGNGCDAAGMPENYKYASDVRHVNIYFYRNAGAAEPYRVYRKALELPVMAYNMENEFAALFAPSYRDELGQAWISLPDNQDYSFSTPGSFRAGLDRDNMVGGTAWQSRQTAPDTDVFGSPDVGLSDETSHRVWRVAHVADDGTDSTRNLRYKFPASKNMSYKVSLGFNSIYGTANPGERLMNVYINGTLMTPGNPGDEDGPVDIMTEVGEQAALTKSFAATAVEDQDCGGCGVYSITVDLVPDAASIYGSGYLSWIKLEKL